MDVIFYNIVNNSIIYFYKYILNLEKNYKLAFYNFFSILHYKNKWILY